MKDYSYYESIQDRKDTTLENIIFPHKEIGYPSHFHKKVEITYIQQGFCDSVIKKEEYHAEKDEILYIPEYHPHSYQPSKDALRLIFIPTESLSLDAQKIIAHHNFPSLLKDKEFNRNFILPVLQNILETQQNKQLNDLSKFLLIKGYINEFYGLLYQNYLTELTPKNEQFENFSKILIYISKHFQEKLTIESLSKTFGYNKHYFSRIFNYNVNDNFQNFINSMRINYFIKKYNEYPNINIMTIAFDAGFDSMPSFYRAFKRIYKCTPKEFFKKEPNLR